MTKLTYIKIFTDFREDIEALTDEEAGRLFRAMLSYADSEELPQLLGNERFVWGTAKKTVDREREKYEHIVDRNKSNIAKRYEPKDEPTKSTTGSFGIPEPTKGYQTYDSLQEKNKNKNKIRNKEENKEEVKKQCKTELEKTIDAFIEHRKKLRSPMTERAIELLRANLDKLASTDEEKIEILNQSIAYGYKGVFPLKGAKEGMGAKAHYKQTQLSDAELDTMFVDILSDEYFGKEDKNEDNA